MQTALRQSNVTDAAKMSIAPGEYGYAAPIIKGSQAYFTEGIYVGKDRVGGSGIDAESQLRGLGVPLSRYDTVTPSAHPTMVAPSEGSLARPVIRSKSLQRGTDAQQFGIRDVYPVADLVSCIPVRPVQTEWGMNTRDVARQSCE